MKTATIHQFPTPTLRAKCSACGTEATCDCNAAYVPAGQRAAAAIVANPSASNRAIAAQVGVSEPTVRRARMATASPDAVAQRIGIDGKARKMPRSTVQENELTVLDGKKLITDAHQAMAYLYWNWFFEATGEDIAKSAEDLNHLRENMAFFVKELDSIVVKP